MAEQTDFEAHIFDLALTHPMLPVKAAVEYAKALVEGRPIPLPDPFSVEQIVDWARHMPAVVEETRSPKRAIHAIKVIRDAGREWGIHIELAVAKAAFEVLLGERERQCDKNPRCNQERGHAGACQFTMFDHVYAGPSARTSRPPRDPRRGLEEPT